MRVGGAAGILGLAALLGGCAGIGNNLTEPDIQLDRVIVRGLGVTGGTLDLVVDIENPNGFDLRGTALEVGFDVEGSHVGDVRFEEDFAVSERSHTTLTLPLRFEWAGVGGALRSALSHGDLPYEMKGQVRLQTPWGQHSVPFTKEGRAPLTRSGGLIPIPSSR